MALTADDLYHIPFYTIDGKLTSLAPYQDKILIIVNVASRCAFTKQYADLEKLYQDYQHRGVMVLGFPCDQFLHQEPGSNPEIIAFAQRCFRITFPLFAKIQVKGPQQSPLYAYLAKQIEKKPLKFIPWNFTKLLIAPQGRVLRQFLPTTSFEKIGGVLEALLAP